MSRTGKYTPGPWEECKGADGTGCSCGLVWSLPADAPVAECDTRSEFAPPTVPDLPERQANARLVATAPELYEELERLVLLLEPVEQSGGLGVPGLATLNKARQVLAKARGED